jgi:cytochrome c-type biogenesis protein CcmE
MTVAPPIGPLLPPRRRRWGLAVAVGLILAVIGYLAFSSVGNALVYYLTPTELLDRGDAALEQTVRLGGLVKVGSVEGSGADLRFVLTDGSSEIRVHSTSAPTRSFREGSGAVLEGRLTVAGIFEATQIIVKHDENYEAPPPGGAPLDRGAFDPGDEPAATP